MAGPSRPSRSAAEAPGARPSGQVSAPSGRDGPRRHGDVRPRRPATPDDEPGFRCAPGSGGRRRALRTDVGGAVVLHPERIDGAQPAPGRLRARQSARLRSDPPERRAHAARRCAQSGAATSSSPACPSIPRRHLVKRVVGLPGETLALRSGTVYIDGAPLDEPYLPAQPSGRRRRMRASGAERAGAHGRFGPLTIPPRHYFVLGDNRDHSQDSRLWGSLPHNSLTGRVVATYWSSAPPEVVAIARPGVAAALRRRIRAASHFVRETRWRRVLRPVR